MSLMLDAYAILFTLCLIAWLRAMRTLIAAHRLGDSGRIRMLRWMAQGLGYSAVSNLFRIIDFRTPGRVSTAGFVFGVIGTLALFAAWIEYQNLTNAGKRESRTPEPSYPVLTTDIGINDPVAMLASETAEVITTAVDMAARDAEGTVDTEHLLLALVNRRSACGTQILGCLDVSLISLHGHLMTARVRPVCRTLCSQEQSADGILTRNSREALKLAANEAVRFGSEVIGTEHLLLGLMLTGTGTACYVLFQNGATVDAIRDEVLRQRVENKHRQAIYGTNTRTG